MTIRRNTWLNRVFFPDSRERRLLIALLVAAIIDLTVGLPIAPFFHGNHFIFAGFEGFFDALVLMLFYFYYIDAIPRRSVREEYLLKALKMMVRATEEVRRPIGVFNEDTKKVRNLYASADAAKGIIAYIERDTPAGIS